MIRTIELKAHSSNEIKETWLSSEAERNTISYKLMNYNHSSILVYRPLRLLSPMNSTHERPFQST